MATFAYDARVLLSPGADERAPGGAVTVALCGSWEHEPPCPLAAHHVGVRRSGDELTLRIVAATEDLGTTVERIVAGLSSGVLTTPDGAPATWRLLDHGPADLVADEAELASRLEQSVA